ncbi:LADA_0F01750g1_1 [Lachancea dasiensis]|uniref:LADA_0F01750g1_1 n=1 Tax=Lachancea dasiensis TaxID=1072105 RepID=A0A1G4JIJ7_9SACH|nr:LADA_0F01750g1_1 [Lachancea dasiensis]
MRLGQLVRIPIIQAPMAGVSTPQLAAAVSNAGALGSIGIGASSCEVAEQKILEVRKLTSKPFNVNVFCHKPAIRDCVKEKNWIRHLSPLFKELGAAHPPKDLNEIYKSFVTDQETFEMLILQKPHVVSFHFGLPSKEWISSFKKNGILTMATATSLGEAKTIEEAGVDFIVAQGAEAGGHRGVFDVNVADEMLTTNKLVQLLQDGIKTPIIAAGGIMNGAHIQAMMSLGAEGVQMGTAFLLCPESATSVKYRESLKTVTQSKLTSVISGRPARGIVNKFVKYGESPNAPTPPAYPIAYDVAKRLDALDRAHRNTGEFGAFWAGAEARLCREMNASQLVSALAREAKFE